VSGLLPRSLVSMREGPLACLVTGLTRAIHVESGGLPGLQSELALQIENAREATLLLGMCGLQWKLVGSGESSEGVPSSYVWLACIPWNRKVKALAQPYDVAVDARGHASLPVEGAKATSRPAYYCSRLKPCTRVVTWRLLDPFCSNAVATALPEIGLGNAWLFQTKRTTCSNSGWLLVPCKLISIPITATLLLLFLFPVCR
jgi:hypothetical protein